MSSEEDRAADDEEEEKEEEDEEDDEGECRSNAASRPCKARLARRRSPAWASALTSAW